MSAPNLLVKKSSNLDVNVQVVGFDFLQDFPFAFDEGFSFDF